MDPTPDRPRAGAPTNTSRPSSSTGNHLNNPTTISSNSNSPSGTPAPLTRTPSIRGSPSATRGPGIRGSRGTAGRSRPAVQTPRHGGRRSAAARAEAEKAEAERKRVEAETRAREERRKEWMARGRGRGRGRGGYVGERTGGERKVSTITETAATATGVFGEGRVNPEVKAAVAAKRRARGGGSGGGGGGERRADGDGGHGAGRAVPSASRDGSSGGRSGIATSSSILFAPPTQGAVKQEPGSLDHVIVKTEDGGYVSSDADEDEDYISGASKGLARLNVDELGVIDLTQDMDETVDPEAHLRDFQPVRVKREVHKDRTLGLNADGVTASDGGVATNAQTGGAEAPASPGAKRKGKQRAKDVEILGQAEKYRGTYSSSDDEMQPQIKEEPVDDTSTAVDPNLLPQQVPSSPESRRRALAEPGKARTHKRTSSGAAAAHPAYQTREELEEWQRHQQELEDLYYELGTIAVQEPRSTDDDTAMDASNEQEQPNMAEDRRADKVYLFQFPPSLPDLLPIKVKSDPDDINNTADAEDPEPMNLDAPTSTTEPLSTNQSAAPVVPINLPSGLVGKLRVHRSGKATLDWGGLQLRVGMGMDATFLQDVVVANVPERKPEEAETAEGAGEGGGGGGERGWAIGMGQVKGKFVVTPDWEEILG